MRTPTRTSKLARLVAGAVLVAGAGLAVAAPASAAPGTPTAVQNPTLIPSRYRAIMVWDAPVSDGGSPITGYVAIASDGTNTYTCTTKTLRCTIDLPLNVNAEYDVVVEARNALGSSYSSPLSMTSWFHPSGPVGATLAGRNLSNMDLRWANFSGKDLSGANLSGTNLQSSYMKGTNLAGTNFSNANLVDVISQGIVGTPVNLREHYQVRSGFLMGPQVNLFGQDLSGMNLTDVNLWRAQLGSVNFNNANLTRTNLFESYIQNATFVGATMTRTNLIGSFPIGANFSGTSLATARLGGFMRSGGTFAPTALPSGYSMVAGHIVGPNVSLYNANLAGQNLSNMNLTNVRFFGANLNGVTMNNTNLSGADMRPASASGMAGVGVSGSLSRRGANVFFGGGNISGS